MNNQMDDFSVQPGVANYFGLIGAEANAIAPGKRPLSSMSPTLVFNGREPIIALGAAGGPRIITTVAQELVAMLDLGKTPAEALAEPRFHHHWSPDELVVETALPEPLRAALLERGHRLKEERALSVSQIVAGSRSRPGLVGAADQRGEGHAAGY
jgi:gamma-glutamyltranspeptidase/glutathione hydrolase